MEAAAKLLLTSGKTCSKEKVKVEMQPVIAPTRNIADDDSTAWMGETIGNCGSFVKHEELMTEGCNPDMFERLNIRIGSLNMPRSVNGRLEKIKKTKNQSKSCKQKSMYKCTFCEYTTPKIKNMEYHLRTHEIQGKTVHSCELCHYRTDDVRRFHVHMSYHSGVKPHACDECSYRCVEHGSLRRHQSLHRGDKPYVCNICPFRTAMKYELNRHHRKFHPENNVCYSCSVTKCNFHCVLPGDLERHMKSHNQAVGPFKCDKCNFTTDIKSKFVRHQRGHSDERLFACSECPYKAKSSHHLSKHEASHTQTIQHCDKCKFSAKDLSTFKTHQLLHEKMKIERSDVRCDEKMSLPDQSHSLSKLYYSCDNCNFKSTTVTSFQNHVGSHLKVGTQTISVVRNQFSLSTK